MDSWVKQNLKTFLNYSFKNILSLNRLQKLGRYILNFSNGENNGDQRTNGEYHFMNIIKKNLADNAVIFDAGANLCEWTLEFCKIMTGNFTVYAFEPAPRTFEHLRKTISNRISNGRIIPVNMALSDYPGEAELFITGDLAGTNSLHHRQAESLGVKVIKSEKVKICTGDKFCFEKKIEAIDLLKIDTEGHEIKVLKGFETMLTESRIGCIQFEYGGCWLDARIQLSDAFNFLLPKGYAIGKLFPKEVIFFSDYDQRLDTFQYSNFVAIRSDLMDLFD